MKSLFQRGIRRIPVLPNVPNPRTFSICLCLSECKEARQSFRVVDETPKIAIGFNVPIFFKGTEVHFDRRIRETESTGELFQRDIDPSEIIHYGDDTHFEWG